MPIVRKLRGSEPIVEEHKRALPDGASRSHKEAYNDACMCLLVGQRVSLCQKVGEKWVSRYGRLARHSDGNFWAFTPEGGNNEVFSLSCVMKVNSQTIWLD